MLICLGGVCVPYTAVVPLVILTLKWIIAKLGLAKYFPKSLQTLLQLESTTILSNDDNGKCCNSTNSSSSSSNTGPSLVNALESEEEFQESVDQGTKTLVCMFTSSWCQPCQKIKPFLEQLSSGYNNNNNNNTNGHQDICFWTIDVDDFEEIAATYNIAMMPTFLLLQGENVLGTYKGSNEHQLKTFLEEHIGRPTLTHDDTVDKRALSDWKRQRKAHAQ